MNNDLISREALKEAIEKNGCRHSHYFDIFDVIDDAPTVEQPTGEWIHREAMDFIDENHVLHQHFMCKDCGFIHDFIDGHTSQYQYCPQCGTMLKMTGGEKNAVD